MWNQGAPDKKEDAEPRAFKINQDVPFFIYIYKFKLMVVFVCYFQEKRECVCLYIIDPLFFSVAYTYNQNKCIRASYKKRAQNMLI